MIIPNAKIVEIYLNQDFMDLNMDIKTLNIVVKYV
jgi:hypothetical protein